MELEIIFSFILYFLIIICLSALTSNSFTTIDIGFRTVTYLLTSILFGYLVWNSYDNTNFKKQLYNHEKYVIKTGTDKDTIIIDKKH